MRNYQSKYKEVTFTAPGETQIVELPRTALIRSLIVKLSGTLNVTVADATLSHEGVKNLAAKLEVVGNGKEQIKNYRGANCFDLAKVDYGTVPPSTEITVTVAGTPANFEIYYPINFGDVGSYRVTDTYLDARQFSSLDLRIVLGSVADLLTIGGATLAWSNLKAEVYVRSATRGEGNFGIAKESTIRSVVSASNTSFQIPLTVGNRIRRLFVKTLDGGDPQNDIINNLILRSGTNVFADAPWEYYRAQNKLDYEIETLDDGVIVVDMCTDGRKMEALPTEGFNQLDLELDVTVGAGTTIVEVIPMELL
jgi:hypothetical protein